MGVGSSTLKYAALGVLFWGIVIAAVYFLLLNPAKERSKAQACESHLKAIIVASKAYAQTHGTGYQTNLICLSNDLRLPWLLVCVDDNFRRRRMEEKGRGLVGTGSDGHWARLTMDDCSYEVFLRDSNTLVLRCTIHKIGIYTVGEARDDRLNNWKHERR